MNVGGIAEEARDHHAAAARASHAQLLLDLPVAAIAEASTVSLDALGEFALGDWRGPAPPILYLGNAVQRRDIQNAATKGMGPGLLMPGRDGKHGPARRNPIEMKDSEGGGGSELGGHEEDCVLFCSVGGASGIHYIVETHQSHNVQHVRGLCTLGGAQRRFQTRKVLDRV